MTRLFSAIWILIIPIISCDSLHDEIDKIPDGVYTGTFQRQLAFGGGDAANVTIIFSSNTWSGQSDKQNYPALCHGTFKIEKGKIFITNLCVFTADFNWSLIFSGEYDFSLKDDSLEIFHNSIGPTSDAWNDKYDLVKQK